MNKKNFFSAYFLRVFNRSNKFFLEFIISNHYDKVNNFSVLFER